MKKPAHASKSQDVELAKKSSLRALAKQSSSGFQLKISLDCFTSFAKTTFLCAFSKMAKVKQQPLIKTVMLLFCLGWHQYAIAGLSLDVDPTSIPFGETFRLTLTLDAMQNHALPDLVPLLKDFEVLGTERNISYTVINGQARSISQWSIILKPKSLGTLSIPPIQVGHEKSLPSQIVVNQATQLPQGTQQHQIPQSSYFIASTNLSKPYIHQQIIYTIRLLTQKRLLDAQYHPPQVEDALIIPLGEGRHQQTQFKNQLYDVEEQQYAVFPQKSGKLIIAPPTLDAMLFDDLGPSRVHLQAKPLVLNVESLPQGQSLKTWLPASKVELEESYDQTSTMLLEGDTLVRTITLKAKDLPAQLLPVLSFENTASYHVYKEKPTADTHFDQGDLWGSVQIQVTYLLSKAGQVVLPAIDVPWFNTITHRQENATLPERSLTVKPRATDQPVTSKPSHVSKPTLTAKNQPPLSHPPGTRFMMWLVVGLMIVGCLGLGFLRRFKRQSAAHPIDAEKMISLKKACKANDPHQARIALIHWAATQWPDRTILNLQDIPLDNPTFKIEIAALSHALYAAQQKNVWNGEALWRCVYAFKTNQQGKKKKSKISLPPINPI